MKQILQLRLSQHLAMTPQLQQAIRLLQLSTLELQTEVQTALDSNLMLEAEEDETPPETERADGANGEADVQPTDIPKELETDSAWEDIYDNAPPPPSSGGGDFNGIDIESQRSDPETLRGYLQWQLELSHLDDVGELIGAAIIDSIDDDGYLGCGLDEVLVSVQNAAAGISLERVEAVLERVQDFDPPGVGARDLAECLSLQLRQLPAETPWLEAARSLVEGSLNLLGARDFTQLMRRLGLDREELQEVVAFIQTLNPRPGAAGYSGPAEYVIPDVIVTQSRGVWRVELNAEALPRVRINREYARLIRRADDSADNSCLKTHLQEAKWFIKSLRSRSETLLKVANCIVDRQTEFLEHGDEAMKPMVLHDVAEAVGMHESTISRVTTQKYMHTPRGLYELKYFFSSHLSTRFGGDASSTAIRALIKKLISAENPGKPMSDSKLASMLSDKGINVARRTVAKYRESMSIPASNERKRLV